MSSIWLYSVALGEMTHARDLLALLLSSTPTPTDLLLQSTQLELAAPTSLPPSTLSHSTVSKPGPLPSVEAFNSQISIGGKDEALRKAASSFKHASESLERGRQKSEQYWSNALKIRRANWGLIPAPLPSGVHAGRGADRTSKDFLVSFGLEECMKLICPRFLLT